MNSFSERMGISKPSPLQNNSLNDGTRNRLWNILEQFCFCEYKQMLWEDISSDSKEWLLDLWDVYFKRKRYEHQYPPAYYKDIEKYLSNAVWYDVYNFIEAVLYAINGSTRMELIICLNEVLEDELCTYRIINDKIVSITSPEEIQSINRSMTTVYDEINTHFKSAISLLAIKPTPDARNSIKESISAVECLCKIITTDKKATMGAAINTFRKKGFSIHQSLEEAYKKMYHWTSDDSGIRHALMESSTVDINDAIYMLVICSAIVNYLIAESIKMGIDLNSNYSIIKTQ